VTPKAHAASGFRKSLRCLGGCLLGIAAAHADDNVATTSDLRRATWQQAAHYLVDRLPACKSSPRSGGVASIIGERISLYYPEVFDGTTESFPLRARYTAEAHEAGDSWRLLVRFAHDVVTSDSPNLNGHGRSSVFSCDGDMETIEGLATALTRLRELATGAVQVGPESSSLQEITVHGTRGRLITEGHRSVEVFSHDEGDRVSLSGRVDVSSMDLSQPERVAQLRETIRDVARSLCRRLDALYPYRQLGTNERCVRDAVATATRQVDELVAAAPKR